MTTDLETRVTVLMSAGERWLNIFSSIRGFARALELLSSLMANFLPLLEIEARFHMTAQDMF